MSTQARIRKLQDTLIVAGDGAIAFGVWIVAKVVALCLFADEEAVRSLFEADVEQLPTLQLYVGFCLSAVFDLMLRALVGRAAIREGRGRRHGSAYLIGALLIGWADGASAFFAIRGEGLVISPVDRIASAAIDVTSCVTLALMVFCALRLRWLAREGK